MTTDIDINTDPVEKEKRISFCSTCEKNVLDILPKCSECDCSLSMLTSFKFKSCPIAKW